MKENKIVRDDSYIFIVETMIKEFLYDFFKQKVTIKILVMERIEDKKYDVKIEFVILEFLNIGISSIFVKEKSRNHLGIFYTAKHSQNNDFDRYLKKEIHLTKDNEITFS